jgi:hypothetical protein
MTRLTGTDAWGLMEAYSAVYEPEEITEEQIWEEVEEWVNSLVEEGYDLSDYTWDDMWNLYEAKVDDVVDKKLKASGVGAVDRIMTKRAARKNRNEPKYHPRTKTQVRLAHRRFETEYDDDELRGARKTRESSTQHESVDNYDIILSHLLDEGYADTYEDAVIIMANMSEDWKENIIENVLDEAQRILSVRSKSGEEKYKEPKNITKIRDAIGRLPSDKREVTNRKSENKRENERIKANKKSIQRLNAKPGEDSGDYDSGYYGDDDTSDGRRHYSLSHTNRSARRRRAIGR